MTASDAEWDRARNISAAPAVPIRGSLRANVPRAWIRTGDQALMTADPVLRWQAATAAHGHSGTPAGRVAVW
jgi:hypothetical protein